jgi:hypothetical protein
MALLFGAPKIFSIPEQECKTSLRLNQAAAAVKATVDNKEDVCRLLVEAIDEAFSAIGESPRKAIYTYLENSVGIAKQEIPHRIKDFSDALEKIFGPGARTLEILCIKNIQAKARSGYDWDLPESIGSELTLKEYMDIVSRTVNGKKAINKRIKEQLCREKAGKLR